MSEYSKFIRCKAILSVANFQKVNTITDAWLTESKALIARLQERLKTSDRFKPEFERSGSVCNKSLLESVKSVEQKAKEAAAIKAEEDRKKAEETAKRVAHETKGGQRARYRSRHMGFRRF